MNNKLNGFALVLLGIVIAEIKELDHYVFMLTSYSFPYLELLSLLISIMGIIMIFINKMDGHDKK